MSCLCFPKRFKNACKRFFSTMCGRHWYTNTAATSKPSLARCQNPTSVYVDRLFFQADPSPSAHRPQEAEMSEPSTNSNSTSGGEGGGWKEYVESMPEIKGIDERAEEFITNFRQQIRIQRELSLLEYQEMLARST